MPDLIETARRELRALAARRAELERLIETERQRRRIEACRISNYPPCDWCGSTKKTVAAHLQWVLTGDVVCATWQLTPCRLAWITGVRPDEFKRSQIERLVNTSPLVHRGATAVRACPGPTDTDNPEEN